MDLQLKATIPVLAFLSCVLAGSVLVDVGREAVHRTTWTPVVATVEEVAGNAADGTAYRLSFRWQGRAREAWTDRDSGEVRPGDRVEVLIDGDDPGNVAMRGWAWDNRSMYLIRFALAGATAAGAFLLARRLWREPGAPRRMPRPRGNPGPRQPAPRKRRRR